VSDFPVILIFNQELMVLKKLKFIQRIMLDPS